MCMREREKKERAFSSKFISINKGKRVVWKRREGNKARKKGRRYMYINKIYIYKKEIAAFLF